MRVLGKSMHVLAAGWGGSIGWLWVATLQQHLLRQGVPPPGYAADILAAGAIPALVMVLIGAWIGWLTGRAPEPTLERREWRHAAWWSLVPILLLLSTVWVMIDEAW